MKRIVAINASPRKEWNTGSLVWLDQPKLWFVEILYRLTITANTTGRCLIQRLKRHDTKKCYQMI